MDKISSQLDLYLTEVSIELLGNKIYDVNGVRQDKLINLFKALPETKENKKSNDFLSSLGYRSDFTDTPSLTEFLDEQLDFILQDANKSAKINQDIIACLRKYKQDQSQLLDDVSDQCVKKLAEANSLTTSLDKARQVDFLEHRQRKGSIAAVNDYYKREKDDLLKMSMSTLRLLKYILNDPQNKDKGEMIGFVHAMRSVKDSRTIRTKPYNIKGRKAS